MCLDAHNVSVQPQRSACASGAAAVATRRRDGTAIEKVACEVTVMRCASLAIALCPPLLASASLFGCAAQSHLAREIHARTAQVLAAVERNALEQGWTVVAAEGLPETLEAVTPVEDTAGLSTRQRWTFRVESGVVETSMAFEAQFAPGDPWQSTHGRVCRTYLHLREREQLERIAQRIAPSTEKAILATTEK
jgi:hypothetical protein